MGGPTSLSTSMPSTSSSPLNGRTSDPPSLPTLTSPTFPARCVFLDPRNINYRPRQRSQAFQSFSTPPEAGRRSWWKLLQPRKSPVLAIERRSQLPADYKATLPTLPHIARRQERPAAGPGAVGEGHQGDEVLEQQTGPKVASRCRRLDHQGGAEVLAISPPLPPSPWGFGEGSAC